MLKIDLPYDPVIPLLGIYPNEVKLAYDRLIYISMFIAVPYTIAYK